MLEFSAPITSLDHGTRFSLSNCMLELGFLVTCLYRVIQYSYGLSYGILLVPRCLWFCSMSPAFQRRNRPIFYEISIYYDEEGIDQFLLRFICWLLDVDRYSYVFTTDERFYYSYMFECLLVTVTYYDNSSCYCLGFISFLIYACIWSFLKALPLLYVGR